MPSNWEENIEYFIENHPETLVETGEDEEDKDFWYRQQLKMHKSYDKMQRTIAFADLIMQLDYMRDEAYSQLIREKEARKAVNPELYVSDEHLKGVITTVANLKNFIKQRIESYDEVIEEYEEYKNEQERLQN